MAKLSVYVPDELLAQAKRADPEVRPSAILQDALRSRLMDRSSRPYAQLDDHLRREREEAQRLVTDRMADAWRMGYAVGIEFAKGLPLEAFEAFADAQFRYANLKWWASQFEEDDTEYDSRYAFPEEQKPGELNILDFSQLLNKAEEVALKWPDQISKDDEGVPTGVAAEGFTDAIRDVWEVRQSGEEVDPLSGDSAEVAQPTDADDDHPA